MFVDDATLLYIIQKISLTHVVDGQASMMKYQVLLSIYLMPTDDG